jgi:redox-sensitive bicupin YhaK (pirin superfamily)
MSNIEIIIAERAADIGNFRVGRLLPFRRKRSVGPFVFIDHMGPAELTGHENLDVLPHPHIGLSTLTWLFEGAIMHRDSLGSAVEIKPGAVNWMTAGKGVVHSERTPEYLRNSSKSVHGLQIWVALPRQLEETDPSFTHVEAGSIPAWDHDAVKFRLIAGEAFGRISPVPVYSRLFFIEISSDTPQIFRAGNDLYGECAVYVHKGTVNIEGKTFDPRQLIVFKDSKLCEFEMSTDTMVYIVGGEPFPEERFIDWNFVSSRRERLIQAKDDWVNRRFPSIPGETEFVPYPVI